MRERNLKEVIRHEEAHEEAWQEEVAMAVLDRAIAEHQPSHIFALFSGGHDSLCSTAVASKHPAFSAAVHINTGIGIADTRTFVRETCERHDWPLIEMHPDGLTYRDLVVEKGMPAGPKAHNTTYYWLKQRQVRRLVREHKQGRNGRIVLATGIRTAESERRMAAVMSVPVHRIGAQVWVNPILDWTKADCHDFMESEGLKRNRVVDLLHRSGECLCGALARRSEFKDIEGWFPLVAQEIRGYERLAAENGHLEDRWASRLTVNRQQMRFDHPLCSSCEAVA
jgi:3'-phosphoadenosine 5'-phosphosulfate sulfotransferase (PAPS reductase)/FAD synthetase